MFVCVEGSSVCYAVTGKLIDKEVWRIIFHQSVQYFCQDVCSSKTLYQKNGTVPKQTKLYKTKKVPRRLSSSNFKRNFQVWQNLTRRESLVQMFNLKTFFVLLLQLFTFAIRCMWVCFNDVKSFSIRSNAPTLFVWSPVIILDALDPTKSSHFPNCSRDSWA